MATDRASGGRRLVHYRHDERDPRGLSSEKLLDLNKVVVQMLAERTSPTSTV